MTKTLINTMWRDTRTNQIYEVTGIQYPRNSEPIYEVERVDSGTVFYLTFDLLMKALLRIL